MEINRSEEIKKSIDFVTASCEGKIYSIKDVLVAGNQIHFFFHVLFDPTFRRRHFDRRINLSLLGRGGESYMSSVMHEVDYFFALSTPGNPPPGMERQLYCQRFPYAWANSNNRRR